MRRPPLVSPTGVVSRAVAMVGLLALLVTSPAAAQSPSPAPELAEPGTSEAGLRQSVMREGIRLELEVEPLIDRPAAATLQDGLLQDGLFQEGEAVTVRLRVSDTASGAPLPGLYPGGWMDRIPQAALVEEGPESCQDKIEAFLGGTLLAVPEVDLNVYYVLALNDDASITVVDPLFGFGGSKLLAKILLPSPGHDWALTEDGSRLFVSMPDSGQVAVVDTATWKLVGLVEVNGRPARLALQRDGHYLWIADDAADAGDKGSGEGSGVLALDIERLKLAGRVPTGAGPHQLVLDSNDRHLFVSNRGAGTVTVVDVGALQAVAEIPTGPAPENLAHSKPGRSVYVTDPVAGTLTVIDADSHRVRARIEAEPGLGRLRFAPGGRLGFALNPERDEVHIIDAASDRISQTADTESRPVQISFSDELAYVHHSASEIVLMVPLSQIGQPGTPVPMVDFPGGQRPYGTVRHPTPTDAIVQAPGANAVLVANPRDQMIYFYKEGMAAPMGSFRNYGHSPRSVQVVDRSLGESQPGVYETSVTLRRPGRYDVAVFLDSPRMFACFPMEVSPNPELELQRRAAMGASLEYLAPEIRTLPPGEEITVRFRLSDPLSGEVKPERGDVRVLAFLVPGIWQQRQWAEYVGEGVYEVRFVPREEGVYRLQVESASLGLALNRSPALSLWVTTDPEQLSRKVRLR